MTRFLKVFTPRLVAATAAFASIGGFVWLFRDEVAVLIYFFASLVILFCLWFSYYQFQERRKVERQLKQAHTEREALASAVARWPLAKFEALHEAVAAAMSKNLEVEFSERLRRIRRLAAFREEQEGHYPLEPIRIKNINGALYTFAKCSVSDQLTIDDYFILKEITSGIQEDVALLEVNQLVNPQGLLALRFSNAYDEKTVESLTLEASKADLTRARLRNYVIVLAESLPDCEPGDVTRAIEIVDGLAIGPWRRGSRKP